MEVAFAARPAPTFSLRQVLIADALTCLAFGLVLVAASATLSGWLGLPPSLLFLAGVVLFPCAALMAVAAKTLGRFPVMLVIGGNVAWIVASLALLFVTEPNGLGVAFVLAQAAAVAALAGLEWRARRV